VYLNDVVVHIESVKQCAIAIVPLFTKYPIASDTFIGGAIPELLFLSAFKRMHEVSSL
jgi:hypothetical protein